MDTSGIVTYSCGENMMSEIAMTLTTTKKQGHFLLGYIQIVSAIQ